MSRQAEQRIVHFVPLAGVTADGDVAGEVASALGAGGPGRTPSQRAVPAGRRRRHRGVLGPGPALLVLDNCEHVLRGAAELVRALVSMTKDLRVLTTSRAPLGLSSESVYLLPELGLPTSVELFGQRARAARPGVDLPADAVEELCRHLDGLPLAVELAAARVRVMSVAEIARGLDDRFALLRGGPRDAPERHQHPVARSSTGAGTSSTRPGRRRCGRCRSSRPGSPRTPRGGCSATATPRTSPRSWSSLVDQSLLQVADTPTGTRFRMLETVREFSTAHREAAGETEQVVDRFLAWARDFGVAHHEAPFGSDPSPSVERIRAEQDNLVQALRSGLARADGAHGRGDVGRAGGPVDRRVQLPAPDGAGRRVGPGAVPLPARSRPRRGHPDDRDAVQHVHLPAPGTPPGALAGRPAPAAAGPAGHHGPGRRRSCSASPPGIARPCTSSATATSRWWPPSPTASSATSGRTRTTWTARSRRPGGRCGPSRPGRPPTWQAVAHARISELCLQVERGDEARRHLLAVLPVLERLGTASDVVGIQWWMVLANLQLGDVDEAEHWLEQTAPPRADEPVGTRTYGLGVRAEILLARGEVEAGLRLWRRAVDLLRNAVDPIFGMEVDPGLEPWTLEVEAVTVVAHAQHGRLDLVEELTGKLPERLTTMLANPVANPPPYLMELPISGALLLALAMVDLDLGARAGDELATGSGVRLVALAERFGFLRNFQPTMSAARARRAAEQADRPAYDDAVSSYAGLGHEDLRAAALAALRERERR